MAIYKLVKGVFALLRRCILASTPADAVILDPFNGSATTGIATIMCGENRKYVGIELEKEYLDLSIKRYEKVKKETNLF